MKIEFLADHKHQLPTLGKWYFEEWGYLNKKNTLEREIERLQTYLNKDKIPLILVALKDDELLGAAQLKYHEMDMFPEKTHWLGGVYVSKNHRGKGIARKLIMEVLELAEKFNVQKLYLQTENLSGGLYRQMGWEPAERVNTRGVEVLVMEKVIDNK